MSRIRTIKPDAFTSESLSNVSLLARWTFAGLWTYFDDAGKGRADTRLIKAALFPLDDTTTPDDIESAVDELIEAGCVHTFMAGGRTYLHAPEFLRHQRINRPTESVLPTCSCQIEHPSDPAHTHLTDNAVSGNPHVSWEGKGRGREEEREGERANALPTTRPPRTCPKHPNGTDTPCGPCADARKTSDAWQKPTLSAKQTKCGDHPNRPALNCPECAAETKTADESVLAKVRAMAKGSAK